jgi:hypothetical protein
MQLNPPPPGLPEKGKKLYINSDRKANALSLF